MIALLGTVFAASVAGSLHCAGMCGGIAAACAPARGAAPSTLAYHACRGGAYALAGAVAGTLGAALELGGELLGIQRLAAIVAGATVALAGVAMLLRLRGFAAQVRMPRLVDRTVGAIGRRAMAMPPVARGATLGAISVLLPCGWLWAFLAVAAGAGSALGGVAVMLLFWAGTVPVLASIGLGFHAVSRLWKGRVAVIAALAMIVVGLQAMIFASVRSDALGAFPLRPAQDPQSAIRRVHAASEERSPCCRGAVAQGEGDGAASESGAPIAKEPFP